ncbi:MAG: phosphopyruvate hydratase [Deltaproteobacteria bacterium]|nr:phosphopyruvate hydratase [Deltaproteobacteria bacterium]
MADTIITDIKYRTIFDSRGVETLEVDVHTSKGSGRVAAPFGAPGSRGEFEAPAYAPAGVRESIRLLEKTLVPALVGMDALEQEKIDALLTQLDGTPNFEKIGGNTAAVLSTAAAKAAADSLKIPMFRLFRKDEGWSLPFPLGNMIGGGAHSLGPAPDMQEHLAVPIGARTIKQAVEINLKVHEHLGKLLEKKDPGFAGGTDDENAWAANLNDFEALQILQEAVAKISDEEGLEIRMGLDLAADRLWDPSRKIYQYQREGTARTSREQLDFLGKLIDQFRLIFVEDGFNSNDYESFAMLHKHFGNRCLICADDIFASNYQRTEEGIKKGSAGAMIIKTNQVGTITGVKNTAALAKTHGLDIVLSHRSGETVDDSIAHLAVAWNALMIKTGVKGGERLSKLNELIRIEEALKGKPLKWLPQSIKKPISQGEK